MSGARPSVVVCTRNRRAAIEECLATLTAQVGLSNGVEIIVVDNGSSDGTGDWLGRWVAEDPPRRRTLFEPVPGLSRAWNRGIDAASGEVVLFIDDDASAPRGWVAAHLAAYDADRDVVAVGGPVALTWPAGRPAWLGPVLEHWYSALDFGDEPIPWPGEHGPYGTNMSIRRSELLAVGGFSPALGRRGRSLLSSEERDLFARIDGHGSIAYEPAALVLHRVLPERNIRRWVLRRGWAQGRSNARFRSFHGDVDRSELVQVCHYELRHVVEDCPGLLRAVARRDEPVVLNEVARRSAHFAGALEQVGLYVAERVTEIWDARQP